MPKLNSAKYLLKSVPHDLLPEKSNSDDPGILYEKFRPFLLKVWLDAKGDKSSSLRCALK